MALLKYFHKKEEARGQKLPDPCGPLGQEVSEKLTEEVNREVALVLESQAESSTRGSTRVSVDPCDYTIHFTTSPYWGEPERAPH